MFFDEDEKDSYYEDLLIRIVKKQRMLLEMHFDWIEKKEIVLEEKRGLFKRNRKYEAYLSELKALEQLKSDTKDYIRKKGYTQGIYWWSIPWEQIENNIIYDLRLKKEVGSWDYKYEWKSNGVDEIQSLFLCEEGHCTNISTEYEYIYREESEYEDYERVEMVRDLNKRIKQYAMKDIMFHDDRPVQVVETGKIYASRRDYYESSDFLLDKSFYLQIYERSLYTVHTTDKLTAVSNGSKHYNCIYVVADYHIQKDGTLDYMKIYPYELCHRSGDIQENAEKKYVNRDAAVACAAYLADCSDVKSVPMRLFGSNIMDCAANYDEAMRQAQIYTCLCHKIV